MASFNFNNMVHKALTGGIDFDTDTFKMALVTSVLTETEKDSFDFKDDVVNEVANGNGYTTGGNTVTLTVAAPDGANNDVEITASSVSWPTSTITAVGAVIYKDTGTPGTSPVVCFIDFNGSVSSTNGTFTVTPSGSIRFAN